MDEMSLSQRIAEMVLANPGNSPGPANRAKFLACREEVRQAIKDGWSILAIYKELQAEGLIDFGYQAFRRYVHALILGWQEPKDDKHEQSEKQYRTNNGQRR